MHGCAKVLWCHASGVGAMPVVLCVNEGESYEFGIPNILVLLILNEF